ncbi:putative bifunctional diguanylate cyclase/phosphodiesterase [Desulfonatronum thioautotrophicum]|uniref:putative bifunctional diguanylate cyclase/phosphodiesterase n=1 Tax=Desulfonatronum thioautotrophicum TaxID=617001 RepID=UPI0005EBB3E3|nr:EAL domain-containing protein [Desulfonatronum thioautotrophicum]
MEHPPLASPCPDQHGPAFCIIDHEERLLHWNQSFADITGIARKGDNAPVFLSAAIKLATPLDNAFPATDHAPRSGHGQLHDQDGQIIPVTFFIHPIPDGADQGKMVRLLLIHEAGASPFQDASLCKVERRYQRIFEMSHRGLAKFAADGSLLYANSAFAKMFGWSDAQGVQEQGMRWWEKHCPVPEQYLRLFAILREQGNISKFQLDVLAKDGQPRKILLDAYVPDDQSNRCTSSFIAVVEDITEQHVVEQQLFQDTFTDQLTGLPNKSLFVDRVEAALRRAKDQENDLFAVAFVDIDDFKVINETYGNVLGDRILVQVGRKLQHAVRDMDLVARYGDDEFVLLLDRINDEREAVCVLERIKQSLTVPLAITEQLETVCSVSIGLVLSPGYSAAAEMLRDADKARYKSMSEKNGSPFPPPPPITLFRKPDLPWDAYQQAMELGEMFLLYRPSHRISDNTLIGFEAMLRWNHPRHGLLHPANFLPLQEPENIVFLTKWMLGQVCSRMHTWHQTYDCPALSATANMTAESFLYPELPETLQTVFEITDLDTCNLKLEFSRMAMHRFDDFGELCMRIKELDIQLAVDDYGTGYSTLLSLQRYPFVPIDTLQVNRRVVARLPDNNYYQEMVWATIMLAHSLGVEVEADGVETPEQLALLRDMHCDSAKGRLFSKPLEPEAAEALLQTHFTSRPLLN